VDRSPGDLFSDGTSFDDALKLLIDTFDAEPVVEEEVIPPPNLLLAAALDYASHGWHVFPVHSVRNEACTCKLGARCAHPAKHPRTESGLKDATTHREVIETWWRWWPDANVAIATGPISNLIVVDVDPEGMSALTDLEGRVGPLSTHRVRTARGWHFYYAHPPGLPVKSRNGWRTCIDIKAQDGYVLAPPSRHAGGHTYAWGDQR
jgi:hypothetical protein